MLGSDVSFLTCDDLHAYKRKFSLNTAGVVVKLLKVRKFKRFLVKEHKIDTTQCLSKSRNPNVNLQFLEKMSS